MEQQADINGNDILQQPIGEEEETVDNGPRFWFVAVVNNHSEKKAADSLISYNCETYIPTLTEEREIRGKVCIVERVVLPAMLFVYCSEKCRKELVNTPYIKRFRVDNTTYNKLGGHPLLVIPEEQLTSFRIALEHVHQEQIIIEETPFVVGEEVEVKHGELKGMRGNIIHLADGKQQVVVALGPLACIKLTIPKKLLKHISQGAK